MRGVKVSEELARQILEEVKEESASVVARRHGLSMFTVYKLRGKVPKRRERSPNGHRPVFDAVELEQQARQTAANLATLAGQLEQLAVAFRSLTKLEQVLSDSGSAITNAKSQIDFLKRENERLMQRLAQRAMAVYGD